MELVPDVLSEIELLLDLKTRGLLALARKSTHHKTRTLEKRVLLRELEAHRLYRKFVNGAVKQCFEDLPELESINYQKECTPAIAKNNDNLDVYVLFSQMACEYMSKHDIDIYGLSVEKYSLNKQIMLAVKFVSLVDVSELPFETIEKILILWPEIDPDSHYGFDEMIPEFVKYTESDQLLTTFSRELGYLDDCLVEKYRKRGLLYSDFLFGVVCKDETHHQLIPEFLEHADDLEVDSFVRLSEEYKTLENLKKFTGGKSSLFKTFVNPEVHAYWIQNVVDYQHLATETTMQYTDALQLARECIAKMTGTSYVNLKITKSRVLEYITELPPDHPDKKYCLKVLVKIDNANIGNRRMVRL